MTKRHRPGVPMVTSMRTPTMSRCFDGRLPSRWSETRPLPQRHRDNDLASTVRRNLLSDGLCRVGTLTLNDLWRARKDARLRAVLSHMDMLVPEGAVSRWASRLVGDQVVDQHLRSDVLGTVLTEARDNGQHVFFVGGSGSQPFDWARRSRTRYPGLILAGAHAPGPDFRDAEGVRRLRDRIRDARAEVVVALSRTTRGMEFPFRCGKSLGARLYFDLRGGPCPSLSRGLGRSVRRPLIAPPPSRVVLLCD